MPKPTRHILLLSGKDSLAACLVQLRDAPNLPYEICFNPTGWDLPETIEWIGKCSSFLGREVVYVGDDLTEICREEGMLPSPRMRFCTRLAKIQPIRDYIGLGRANVYYGLRSDEQDRVGYQSSKNDPITPVYPLRRVGYGIKEVWELIAGVGLLPPAFHWEWMECRIRQLLTSVGGSQIHLRKFDALPPWQQRAAVAWRSRNNCDRCFYARQYEYIGLYEHHPNLFWDAVAMEESNLDNRSSAFTFRDYPLRTLIPRADEIKERRARAISSAIRENRLSDDRNELDTTSCGLLCGK